MPDTSVYCVLTRTRKACDSTLADAKEYDHTKVGDWNSDIIVRRCLLPPTSCLLSVASILTNAEYNPQSPHLRDSALDPLNPSSLPLHRQQHHRPTRPCRQGRRRGRQHR